MQEWDECEGFKKFCADENRQNDTVRPAITAHIIMKRMVVFKER
jgi:hypothetical protein